MVYLIHFDKPFKHAKHYIGFCDGEDNLEKRMEYHKKGRGARLMDAITKAGIGFQVARTWLTGDRTFERRLKNGKNAPKLCPICNPEAFAREKEVA